MKQEIVFSELCAWINNNGGFANEALGLKVLADGDRSVRAEKEIRKDELLLNIPPNLRIQPGDFSGIPSSDKMNLKGNFWHFDRDLKMTALLLFHQNLAEKSFFEPYLSALPEIAAFEEHPLRLFDEKQTPALEKISPRATKMLQERKQKFALMAERLSDFRSKFGVFDAESVSEKNLLHVYLCVCTRQWEVSGMVPLADMLQHDNRSSVCLFHDTDGQDYMFAERKIKRGEEIFDNYRVFDHAKQYTCYGFIADEQNLAAERMIQPDDDFEKKFREAGGIFLKREWRKYCQNTDPIFSVSERGFSSDWRHFLRIACLDAEEKKKVKLYLPYYKNPVSSRNEGRVLEILRNFIETIGITEENIALSEKVLCDEKAGKLEKKFALITFFDAKIKSENLIV
jgi:hypothetical protein